MLPFLTFESWISGFKLQCKISKRFRKYSVFIIWNKTKKEIAWNEQEWVSVPKSLNLELNYQFPTCYPRSTQVWMAQKMLVLVFETKIWRAQKISIQKNLMKWRLKSSTFIWYTFHGIRKSMSSFKRHTNTRRGSFLRSRQVWEGQAGEFPK